MRRIPFIIGGALGLCVSASVCLGDTMDLCFKGMGNYQITQIWLGGDWLPFGPNTYDYYAGFMKYDVSNVTGSQHAWLEGRTIYTFCVDVYESVSQGQCFEDVPIVLLSALPVSPNEDPMGEQRAGLIGALYYTHWDDAWNGGGKEAAAMQIAIWEFTFEPWVDFTPDEGDYESTGFDPLYAWNPGETDEDGFKVSNNSAGALADEWMADAWGAWWADEWCHNSLYGADMWGMQGIIIPIPIPAPIALAGVGLLGVVAGRRKLAQLVK